MRSIMPRVSLILGVSFIAAGFICNEWLLARLFSLDGSLAPAAKKIVWAAQFLFIGSGTLLIYFRDNIFVKIDLAVFFTGLIVCFVLGEVFLKVTGLPENKRSGPVLFMPNPNNTGSYRLKPDLDLTTRCGEQIVVIKTNSHGMRSPEADYANLEKKTRIAFVGDSITFGYWSGKMENSFVGVFASQLGKGNFEVLNFGTGGYGPVDIELQIKEEIIKFKPDYIFLMFFNGNDFADAYLGKDNYEVTSGHADRNRDNFRDKVPQEYWGIEATRELSHASKTTRGFVDELKLFKLIYKTLNEPKKVDRITLQDRIGSEFKIGKSFLSSTFWSQKPYPQVAVKAKEAALETLDRIRKFCLRNNIRLVIAALPAKEQVYASSVSGENYDIRLPQKYIEEYSKETQILYFDLLVRLREYVRRNNRDIYVSIKDDTHPSIEGYRLIGELLADFFKEKVRHE